MYGADIVVRLKTAGFVAHIQPVLAGLPVEIIRREALEDDDRVIIVARRAKPSRVSV